MRCKSNLKYNFSYSRNLDINHARWLRFEIEITSGNMLNVSLFDQADPAQTLYLATLDNESFQMIQAQQNLVIEQFSLLPGHLITLFDHCILC